MPTNLIEWFRQSVAPYLAKIKATYYTKIEVDGFIANAGENNVQADYAQTDTIADDFIKNKPNLALKADLVAGKIPAMQLPTYVDDVLEFPTTAGFPTVGEVGVIYIPIDTGVVHRWGGTAYVELTSTAISGDSLLAPFTVVTAIEANNDWANA